MATSDARHEFVATSAIVTSRTAAAPQRLVAVIHDTRRPPFYTLRPPKPKVYRALSGVSFQSSVSTGGADDGAEDDAGYYADRWDGAPALMASTASTVCVTFVNRDAGADVKRKTSAPSSVWIGAESPYSVPYDAEPLYDVPYASDDDAGVEMEEQQVASCFFGALKTPPASSDSESDSEFSCLDLSIFEPTTPAATASEPAAAFIYRPPRPPRRRSAAADVSGADLLQRGKSLRDKIKKKLFTAPEPPPADYGVPEAPTAAPEADDAIGPPPVPEEDRVLVCRQTAAPPVDEQSADLPPAASASLSGRHSPNRLNL